MKTKIIYISGSEIFDIADIRAAFEEVRGALNLDSDTVLFGVPVDNEDAGLATAETTKPTEIVEEIIETTDTPEIIDETPEQPNSEDIIEPEPAPKKTSKRARSRKIEEKPEPVSEEQENNPDEKIIPILSVLSVNDADENESENIEEPEILSEPADEVIEISEPDISVTETLSVEEAEQIVDDSDANDSEILPDSESDLEQLLSTMKPLAEDISEETIVNSDNEEIIEDKEDENIDATLEQLATEFVKNQDKISSENKNSTRSKIGKLRNILPFKQSKHKDQGLGDLFGWAGIAANDEDFSVPGFFTNASSRK